MRPTFPFDATEAEMAAMGQHMAYWQQQAEAGPAIAVGPVFDPAGAWGLALVEADDEAQARRLSEDDPITGMNLGFSYEVLPVPSLILRRG
ncbi:conserved hypothetical protein [Azorhizobium caulinodans ORS 571]|uniref:YCII-related domain-containing protein n=1 Tax=Azorhizobium caulinodans (strain ATCC 43989 / DSM 5975 / JCM 20966 / LMG 6465 / NBRC 14845 / NCIMB 13405 / ORS 571) TaxID=438753 RepID=A8ILB5_AZOC5|nr:conserved hypothetical protein [Azorhizobium caulinodans ORS 571]